MRSIFKFSLFLVAVACSASASTDGARAAMLAGKWLPAAAELADLPNDASESDLCLKLELWLILGRATEGRGIAESGITRFPQNAQLQLFASRCAQESGDLTAAVSHAQAAVDLAPADAEVLLHRFRIAQYVGDDGTQAKMRDAVKSLARNHVRAVQILNALAGVTAESDPHGAWRSWQQATTADSTYIPAYLDGAEHCLNKYAWDFAKERYEKALAAQPNHPDALAGLAAVAMENTRYDYAGEQIEAVLAINPDHSLAHLLKAQILIAERRPADSLHEIEAVLAVNGSDIQALAMLAAHYDGSGDTALRDQAIAKAQAIHPSGAEVFITLANAADRRYRFAESVAWARRAIAADPAGWQAEYQAGVGLLRLGEEKEGYKLLDSSFKKNGFNLWAYNMLLVLDKDFKKKEFVYRETEHFFIKMDKEDDRTLWPYLSVVLEDAWAKFIPRYGLEPHGPKETKDKVLILFLPSHTYFSARTVGLPGMHAAGACFGQVITMPSPRMAKGQKEAMNWVKVLEHEFAHVLALQRSDYRVPRWFTEGLSTVEEQDSSVQYDSLLKWAVRNDKLLPIEDMDVAFSRPRFAMQIPLAYYHASLVCDYLIETFGFEVILKLLDGYRDGGETPTLLPAVTGRTLAQLNQETQAYVRKRTDQIFSPPVPDDHRFSALVEKNSKGSLKPDEWVELAWGYLTAGNADQVRLTAEMADTVGRPGEAALLLGIAAWRLDHNAKEALAHFAVAREKLPEHPLPLFYIGVIHREQGDDAAAVAALDASCRLGPRAIDGPESPFPILAEIYTLGGEPDKAVDLYRRWTKVDSTNAAAWRSLGELLLAAGDAAGAGEAFQRLIELNPYEPSVHWLAAEAWEAAEKPAMAERNYRVLLSLEPRNLPVLYRLIRRLIDTNRKDEAREFLDRIRFFAPDDAKAAALAEELAGK